MKSLKVRANMMTINVSINNMLGLAMHYITRFNVLYSSGFVIAVEFSVNDTARVGVYTQNKIPKIIYF